MSDVSSRSSLEFLCAEPGDYVVVGEESPNGNVNYGNYWIAQVIYIFGGARNACDNSLFQVVNIDSGIVKMINADLVMGILCRESTK